MHSELLFAIGISIVAASALAVVARIVRQPLILGYIGAGILLGPTGFGLITNQEEIALLSELGLAFLLFIVGLEIDLKKFARSGRSSAIIGTVQVVVSAVLLWAAARALGFEGLTATYLGITLAFSSTMVVVKLLSDRNELDTLPGRITLGILLVQDVLAIVVLAMQGNIDDPSFLPIVMSLLYGVGLVAVAFGAAKFLLPRLFRLVAQDAELMLVLSIAWCFFLCWLAMEAGFSLAMGALIAGVSISTYPYSHEVIVKIRSLRDFFVTLFFVALGMQIIVTSIDTIVVGLVLSAVIIVTRVATILPAAASLRLGGRVGVLSSLYLSQSSEFSLVIATIGVGLGHIAPDVVSLIAITLVVTSTLTTYAARIAHQIASGLTRWMGRTGVAAEVEPPSGPGQRGEIILLGCHRLGSALVHELSKTARPLRVFDFNPVVLDRLRVRDISAVYVDISNLDAIEAAGLEEAAVIISSVPDDMLRGTSNMALLRYLKARNVSAAVVVIADSAEHALDLYEEGADHVILPSSAEALDVTTWLGCGESIREQRRQVEMEELRRRDEVLK
ncbi:MAG: cation:proton antiporter [Bacteroidetes bacterium]|jgi:Kef-type K+ transport system membrane component KefB|nr:cation:proton antiporter [Bacteroidota bacterium]